MLHQFVDEWTASAMNVFILYSPKIQSIRVK
jgi:hypothetical protein